MTEQGQRLSSQPLTRRLQVKFPASLSMCQNVLEKDNDPYIAPGGLVPAAALSSVCVWVKGCLVAVKALWTAIKVEKRWIGKHPFTHLQSLLNPFQGYGAAGVYPSYCLGTS